MTIEELNGEMGKLEWRLNNRIIALENKPVVPIDIKTPAEIIDIKARIMTRDQAILSKFSIIESKIKNIEDKLVLEESTINKTLKLLSDMGSMISIKQKSVVEKIKDLFK